MLRAGFPVFQAESAAAGSGANRAATPANGANSIGSVVTIVVAETGVVLLLRSAGERLASSSAVGILVARHTDVGHSVLAIRGADAAPEVMEAFAANGIP